MSEKEFGRKKSLEFLDTEIRVLEYVNEARIFAGDFLDGTLSPRGVLGFDENIKFTKPAFDTSVSSSHDISYSSEIRTITFNTGFYFLNFESPEDLMIERAIVAAIIFHEYAHHIQTLIGRTRDRDRARSEDTADYFSGFMLAKFLEYKKLHLDRTKLFEYIKKTLGNETFDRRHFITLENRVIYGTAEVEYFSDSFRSMAGHANDELRLEIFKKGFEGSGDIAKLNEFFLNYKTI